METVNIQVMGKVNSISLMKMGDKSPFSQTQVLKLFVQALLQVAFVFLELDDRF